MVVVNVMPHAAPLLAVYGPAMTTLSPAVGEAIQIWLSAEGRIEAERDPFAFDERDPIVNRATKEYLFHQERGSPAPMLADATLYDPKRPSFIILLRPGSLLFLDTLVLLCEAMLPEALPYRRGDPSKGTQGLLYQYPPRQAVRMQRCAQECSECDEAPATDSRQVIF